MKQVTPKSIIKKQGKKDNRTSNKNKKCKHIYGTSKLERDFAKNFLETNNIPYIYQYEAKDIKRFYDFAILEDNNKKNLIIEEKNGLKSVKQDNFVKVAFFIEVDGDYW